LARKAFNCKKAINAYEALKIRTLENFQIHDAVIQISFQGY